MLWLFTVLPAETSVCYTQVLLKGERQAVEVHLFRPESPLPWQPSCSPHSRIRGQSHKGTDDCRTSSVPKLSVKYNKIPYPPSPNQISRSYSINVK